MDLGFGHLLRYIFELVVFVHFAIKYFPGSVAFGPIESRETAFHIHQLDGTLAQLHQPAQNGLVLNGVDGATVEQS